MLDLIAEKISENYVDDVSHPICSSMQINLRLSARASDVDTTIDSDNTTVFDRAVTCPLRMQGNEASFMVEIQTPCGEFLNSYSPTFCLCKKAEKVFLARED